MSAAFAGIVAHSPAMTRIFGRIETLSHSDASTLSGPNGLEAPGAQSIELAMDPVGFRGGLLVRVQSLR